MAKSSPFNHGWCGPRQNTSFYPWHGAAWMNLVCVWWFGALNSENLGKILDPKQFQFLGQTPKKSRERFTVCYPFAILFLDLDMLQTTRTLPNLLRLVHPSEKDVWATFQSFIFRNAALEFWCPTPIHMPSAEAEAKVWTAVPWQKQWLSCMRGMSRISYVRPGSIWPVGISLVMIISVERRKEEDFATVARLARLGKI